MRHATGLFAVITISSLAAADSGNFAKAPTAPPPPPKPAGLSASAKLLEPIQVESLTLTPIIKTDATAEKDNLLVLDEAMSKKLVRIHEIEQGSVNNLTLTNNADQPVFLLAGEVIIGGKQDRIIGSNTIIPPKKTQTVPVFCVEHGRWQGNTKEFTTAKALAHGRLRGRANFDTQSDVWAEVAAKNELRNTKSSTDTYRKVATQQGDGTLGNWEKQVNTALAKLPAGDQQKLVGFAVSLNGKVASVDVFDSPGLFKKLQGKLVRSYITDAIDVKKAKDIKPPSEAQVKDFIADAEKAKEEDSFSTELSDSSFKKGGKAAKARVMYKPAKSAGPAPASPPKAVYETYQAR